MGYWGGISPKGRLGTEYRTKEVKTRLGFGTGSLRVIDAEDVARFYRDFYR
jgi:hypothetical protein